MDEKEKNLYLGILIAVLLIGSILIYFLISILTKHQDKRKMQEESMRRLLKAIEEERSRISNDLHDEINPLLSTIKFHLGTMNEIERTHHKELHETNQIIDDIISSLKTISYDLMPVMIMRNKVTKAIEDYCLNFTNRKQISIILSNKIETEIESNIGIQIFRMIQEIIQNTIKHANTKFLYIELAEDKEHFILITKDEGIGYDKTKISYEGKGLQSIQLRVSLLNGKFTTNSIPTIGTQYEILIPKTQI